ncbi:hypothetical protein PM082_024728 [Marasmius tenuissimus]|nr:hypothetical protein PM082_024728 [Marasmius tenuissimus]
MPPDTCEDHRITRTPSSQSCHEFAEAIGPILDKYLDEIQDPNQKREQTRLFMAEVFRYWFEVWPVPERIANNQERVRELKRVSTGIQKLIFRLLTEFPGGPGTSEKHPSWWTQLRVPASQGCTEFQRWANKEYIAELRAHRRSEYAREKEDFNRFINPPGVSFYGNTPQERFERLVGAYWWIEGDFPHLRDFLQDEEEDDYDDF